MWNVFAKWPCHCIWQSQHYTFVPQYFSSCAKYIPVSCVFPSYDFSLFMHAFINITPEFFLICLLENLFEVWTSRNVLFYAWIRYLSDTIVTFTDCVEYSSCKIIPISSIKVNQVPASIGWSVLECNAEQLGVGVGSGNAVRVDGPDSVVRTVQLVGHSHAADLELKVPAVDIVVLIGNTRDYYPYCHDVVAELSAGWTAGADFQGSYLVDQAVHTLLKKEGYTYNMGEAPSSWRLAAPRAAISYRGMPYQSASTAALLDTGIIGLVWRRWLRFSVSRGEGYASVPPEERVTLHCLSNNQLTLWIRISWRLHGLARMRCLWCHLLWRLHLSLRWWMGCRSPHLLLHCCKTISY